VNIYSLTATATGRPQHLLPLTIDYDENGPHQIFLI
jgi:hypothetical protein